MGAAIWLHLAAGIAALIAGLRLASRAVKGTECRWLHKWLGRATAHPLGGVATGIVATALVHSSSLTTIATVGLVGAEVLSLEAAVPVIMGANVGTTLAVQFLAWHPSPWLPLLLGVAAVCLAAVPRFRRAGGALGGGALLLAGLHWIDAGSAPLGRSAWFVQATWALAQNPWLGVAAGAVLTTLVLSSTLTIGILQRLTAQGLLPLAAALPVLFGDNIGTTTDTLLASAGLGREAQRAALFHLLFNLAGTLIFLPALPWVAAAVAATSADPARQLANAHVLFNVTSTLLLLPVRGWLVAVTRLVLPDRR